ncbi:MAG: hypothetical protein HOV81_07365 [Kofleriaceae bacterium]|nr:hypothetical protein [Kofleriaceae bacterium]
MIRTSLVICALVGTAAAQAPGNEDANKAFLEGRDLLTSNRTEEACQKFEESIALDPTAPGVMLNLGLCYERLERYATSLFWFRKAQVAAAEAHLPAYEDEAKRHTLALATKVSIVKVDASAAPAGVEIRIDDKRIAPIEYARIEVDRGSHELEARADGKPPYRKSFEVTSRDAGTLVIPRFTDEVTPTPADTEPTEPGAAAPRGRIILAASLGGAGLALCIASPLWARHTKHAYDDAVAAGEMPSASSARIKQHVATGMFVAGAAAVGVAAYLYFTRPTQTTTIAPIVDGEQVGIAITGSL